MCSGLFATKYNTLQPFKETRQKLHKPSCFNFSFGFDVLLFDFSAAYFFDGTDQRCTNADLKIYKYLCLHIKILC